MNFNRPPVLNAHHTNTQLASKIINLPDLPSRQEEMCQVLKRAGMLSDSEASDLVKANNSFYKKLTISHNYKPAEKLQDTKVNLLRASGSSSRQDEDYGLRALCQHVSVHLLDGTHDTFFRGAGEQKALNIISPLFSP